MNKKIICTLATFVMLFVLTNYSTGVQATDGEIQIQKIDKINNLETLGYVSAAIGFIIGCFLWPSVLFFGVVLGTVLFIPLVFLEIAGVNLPNINPDIFEWIFAFPFKVAEMGMEGKLELINDLILLPFILIYVFIVDKISNFVDNRPLLSLLRSFLEIIGIIS